MQQHVLSRNASLSQPNRLDCGGARLSGNRSAGRPDNEIDQVLRYDVFRSENMAYDFRIIDAKTNKIEDCHTYPNVDISSIRKDLKQRGMEEGDVNAFIEKYLMR